MNNAYPWTLFFILWIMGLIAVVLLMPYAMAINPAMKTQTQMPFPVLLALTIAQNAVLLALATGVGLLAARASGLGAPIFEAALRGQPALPILARVIVPAVALGALAGGAILALDLFGFMPHLPEALRSMSVDPGPLKGFLASFYGGIAEELLMRLFVLSGLAWLLGRFWQAPNGLPATGAVITAMLIATVLFGLGHLPATAAITPLTPLIVARAVLLNGLGGVVFGLLYWKLGLEAAMISHFTADLFLHVLGPVLTAAVTRTA
jgi:hypothetical protein